MKQLTRIEYLLRHVKQVSPYATPAKIFNLLLNVVELRLKISRPWSLPPYIKVEPTPLCQLACPGCAHGTSDLKKQLSNQMHLTLDAVKKIIDPISGALFGVSLSLRGEPLLGKDLLPIVEYIHSKRIAVSFPTNLSMNLRQEQIERLVRSGVDSIFVSLDGASEETYRQYRVGGNFDLVLRNVRKIHEAKQRLGYSRPRVVWKFVVLKHNEHEAASVASTYRSLGFDAYELVQDYHSDAVRQARRSYNADVRRKKTGCYWAWHTTVIRADGRVAPCCLGHEDFALGNVNHGDIRSIWRGEPYARLRRGFKTMHAADMHEVCARCLGVAGDRSLPLTIRKETA
jgi:radical SAM protein with 4Fe4S-binding SPASM domain